jgi:ureidoglycolate lyase
MAEVAVDVQTRTVTAEPLTLDGFAPYGRVLTAAGEKWAPGQLAEVYSCGLLDADVPVEFIVARAGLRPFTLTFLERHFQLAQTFVPLNMAPFVLVVGRRNDADDDAVVDADDLRAFIVPGDTGITINKRVWHEAPLPLVNDAVLLTTSHASLNLALQQSNQERTATDANDIDRRDLRDALGYVVRVGLP